VEHKNITAVISGARYERPSEQSERLNLFVIRILIMRITLERLKTKAGEKWLSKRLSRLVRIIGDGWYWRENRAGYTDCKSSAGVYELGDAWNASSHCGKEKHIVYEFCDAGEKPTHESRGKARLALAL